jgi:hypothetical protein
MFYDYKENISLVEKINVLVLEMFTYFHLTLIPIKKRHTLSCLVIIWKWEPRLGLMSVVVCITAFIWIFLAAILVYNMCFLAGVCLALI